MIVCVCLQEDVDGYLYDQEYCSRGERVRDCCSRELEVGGALFHCTHTHTHAYYINVLFT